jgi:hypothetical protein
MKSSTRSRRPSIFSPDGSVTVTVVGLTRTGAGAPRPPPLPGSSHVCCSSRGSAIFVARPRRSPVVEWHDAHFALKNALSGGGVADDDARRLEAGLVVAGGAERVQERRDVGNLRVGERELRHAGAPGTDDRRDQLSVVVGEDHLRAQQARPAVAAAGVGAMAELAVDAVERLAALDRRGIAGRTHRIVEAPLRRRRGRRRGRLRDGSVCCTHHDDQRGNRRTGRVDPGAAGSAPLSVRRGRARSRAWA